MKDIRTINRDAWDGEVTKGNPWTIPVTSEEIEEARNGNWFLLLTPQKKVPHDWYPPLRGCDVLCLASGGGQQGPIMAAVGANVTVLDNSPGQLQRDHEVAKREELEIKTVEGDMRDLHMFANESFDFIIHPVSNLFVPDIQPVWNESFRVLRKGGSMISGFNNPIRYMFDFEKEEQGILEVKYPLPYSDLESNTREERQKLLENGEPFEFSHMLETQIGGQIAAGFMITGFYEDRHDLSELSKFTPIFIATRALKPG